MSIFMFDHKGIRLDVCFSAILQAYARFLQRRLRGMSQQARQGGREGVGLDCTIPVYIHFIWVGFVRTDMQ